MLDPFDAEARWRGADHARDVDGDLLLADLREGVVGAGMLLSAHKKLVLALGDAEKYLIFGYPEARASFEQQRRDIEANVDLSAIAENFEPDGYAIGRSKREREYRLWCLRHDLFLNLLNELGPNTVAAHDPLVLPSFVTKLGEPPALISYFNQLKQEFVSARWTFFGGIQNGPAHLSARPKGLLTIIGRSSRCPGLVLSRSGWTS